MIDHVPILFLTSPCGQEYLLAIPLLYGARCNRLCDVDSGVRWPPRCRTLTLLSGSLIPGRIRDRRRQNGRTVQVHVRATARTNGTASALRRVLGHAASRKVHCVRNAGVCAASEACCFPCASAHGATCSPTWRRGRGETPCRSARPFKGNEEGIRVSRPACPGAGQNTGR